MESRKRVTNVQQTKRTTPTTPLASASCQCYQMGPAGACALQANIIQIHLLEVNLGRASSAEHTSSSQARLENREAALIAGITKSQSMATLPATVRLDSFLVQTVNAFVLLVKSIYRTLKVSPELVCNAIILLFYQSPVLSNSVTRARRICCQTASPVHVKPRSYKTKIARVSALQAIFT